MTTYSVTEVRNALRCPRIFAIGRTLGQQVAFPVGASSLGATFHRLVERFAREATEAAAPVRPAAVTLRDARSPDQIEQALADWLISLLCDELVAAPSLCTMPAEVDDLAVALRQLAGYLAAEVAGDRGREPAAALAALLAGTEEEAFSSVRVGDEVVLVSGRADAVFARPDATYDVVEYKLTDGANEPIDRAQVALYRHLLSESTGASASAVLLRFTPTLRVTRLGPAEADALIQERVLPVLADMLSWQMTPQTAPPPAHADLCPACPVRAECTRLYPGWLPFRDEPPSGAQRPRPERSGLVTAAPEEPPVMPAPPATRRDSGGEEEGQTFRERILEILKRRRVPAMARQVTVGPRLLTVEITVKHGPIRALDAAADDVLHQLQSSHGAQASFSKEGARRLFRTPRQRPRSVELADLLSRAGEFLRQSPGRFLVGESEDGTAITADLADSASPHLLVGGTTGSGKSVFLRALATSLVHFHGPEAIQLTLVDPKRVSFQRFAVQVAAHLSRPLAYDVGEAIEIMEGLVEEMRERYELFAGASVDNLDEYNEGRPVLERLPRRVAIIDEFQGLLVEKDSAEAFFQTIRQLSSTARAAGIHLVLATQRPEKSVVPGIIKENLPGKIALRVQNRISSNILLGTGGAELLLGAGDLIADLGRGQIRAQAPLA